MNIDDITPQQARVAFKGWSVKKQRKFLEGLLEEHAYYCGVAIGAGRDVVENGFKFATTSLDHMSHTTEYWKAYEEGYEHGRKGTK